MIKTLLFDNNGVLTASDKECTIANFAKYFEIEEIALREVFDEFARLLDDGSETSLQFYQKIADHFGKSFDENQLRKVHIESYQPKPGMRERLENLRHSYEIAMLTNFGDVFDAANENVWHYDSLFEPSKMFVSCKMKMRKPNAVIYLAALSGLGKAPHEVVFIDDREDNLVAPRKLGMHTILFHSPEQFENELELLLEKENG